MSEVPKECLYLEKCKELVTKGEYEAICTSGSWIYCSRIPEEIVKKDEKTPIEWKKLKENKGECK